MTHLDAQHVNRTGIMIRGLIILLCAGIINATSVFITPLAAYYGWEASAIANIGTTMLTFWPIGSIVGGKLLQKFGGKAVTLIGAIVFGAGLILTGLVPNSAPGLLYFTYSFLIGMGNGITYCGAMYCVMGWYPDKKGLAAGLCMAFNGGSSYEPLIASLAIDCGVKVNILGADTRNVSGKAFGSMLLGLPQDAAEAARALSYLRAQKDVTVEEVRDYHA